MLWTCTVLWVRIWHFSLINIFLAFLNPHNLLSMEADILLVSFLLFDPKVLTLICQAFLSQGIHVLTTQWKKQ